MAIKEKRKEIRNPEQNKAGSNFKKIKLNKDSVTANKSEVFQVSGPEGADPLARAYHMNPD
eukprot:5405100-Heterocapsa_arctica.AAC.1